MAEKEGISLANNEQKYYRTDCLRAVDVAIRRYNHVAIPRFLLLMLNSEKIGTRRLCRYPEVVVIRRCRYREVLREFSLNTELCQNTELNLYPLEFIVGRDNSSSSRKQCP